jgi:hypothetical protein
MYPRPKARCELLKALELERTQGDRVPLSPPTPRSKHVRRLLLIYLAQINGVASSSDARDYYENALSSWDPNFRTSAATPLDPYRVYPLTALPDIGLPRRPRSGAVA